MNVGAYGGIVGSAAGAPAAQARGAETQQQAGDVAAARRQKSDALSEAAAGIGRTDEDQQTGERDADGRLPWSYAEQKPETDETTPPNPGVKDPTGQAGNQLDLSG